MLKLKHSPPQQHTHIHTLIPTHSHIAKIVFHFRVEVSCCLLLGFWFGCEMQSKYVTTHKAETAIAAVAGTTTATTTGNLFCSLRKRSSSSAAAEGSPSRSAAVAAAAVSLSRHDSRVSLARVCACSRDEQMLESKYRSRVLKYLRGVC